MDRTGGRRSCDCHDRRRLSNIISGDLGQLWKWRKTKNCKGDKSRALLPWCNVILCLANQIQSALTFVGDCSCRWQIDTTCLRDRWTTPRKINSRGNTASRISCLICRHETPIVDSSRDINCWYLSIVLSHRSSPLNAINFFEILIVQLLQQSDIFYTVYRSIALKCNNYIYISRGKEERNTNFTLL